MFAGASLDENSGAFCELKANFFRLILTKAELVALKWSDIEDNYINISHMEVEDYDIVIDENTNKAKVIPKGYK